MSVSVCMGVRVYVGSGGRIDLSRLVLPGNYLTIGANLLRHLLSGAEISTIQSLGISDSLTP